MLARNLYLPQNAPTTTVNGEAQVISNRFVILLTDGNPTHMLGTRQSHWLWGTTGYTTDSSSTSTTNLTGNLLDGVEDNGNVPPARQAAADIAAQIKAGGFNNNYTAQLYTIGFGISRNRYAN